MLAHPKILSAAVVGIKDEKWGEIVGCFCEFSSAMDMLSEKDIKLWLRKQGTAAHKMPDHYFIIGNGGGIPDTIPVNSSGKVVKAELRSIAEEILSQRSA